MIPREYAEQLKSSRDKLAAAATTGAGEAASTNAEKRTLLTQKASIQRLEAETRRYDSRHFTRAYQPGNCPSPLGSGHTKMQTWVL